MGAKQSKPDLSESEEEESVSEISNQEESTS